MGSDPLDDTDLAGNTNNSSFNEYVFFNGKRIARRDSSNNVNYYFADHLGTARVVANSVGTILDDSDFYPFGGERPVFSSSGNTYKFTGKERDAESGLDNFEARYNSSSIGRFTSPDPFGGHQEDPQTLNKYAYVRNNPLNLTDPTGLDFYLDCAETENNGRICQGGHAGRTVTFDNGSEHFIATRVYYNKDTGALEDQWGGSYTAEVDSGGVHLSSDGGKTSSTGSWVDGSSETKFTQQTGALAGFRFDFSQPRNGQRLRGDLSFSMSESQAEGALGKAGFNSSLADNIGNPLHAVQLLHFHFRSPGEPGTGRNSAHFILQAWQIKAGILYPPDFAIPRTGEFHFGETNPNVNRTEHFLKDVF